MKGACQMPHIGIMSWSTTWPEREQNDKQEFVINYCEKRGKNYEAINYEKQPKKEAGK